MRGTSDNYIIVNSCELDEECDDEDEFFLKLKQIAEEKGYNGDLYVYCEYGDTDLLEPDIVFESVQLGEPFPINQHLKSGVVYSDEDMENIFGKEFMDEFKKKIEED